ncbi:MAG: hypothetical protein LBT40_18825 [Deltaproteobacteria bacterium]|jgi:hypothetical protein|nr:hypothetical protein [Deltaproteobacteria bacterium]
MISSLLSMANNALIYTHKPVTRAGGASPPINGPSYQDEREVRESESRYVGETRPAAQEDRFSESLASRLRETGLTGPDSAERIAAVTDQAREVVSQIRREDGAAEANRAMAQILTEASADNAEEVIAAVASGQGAGELAMASQSSSSPARSAGARPAGPPPGGPPPAAAEDDEDDEETLAEYLERLREESLEEEAAKTAEDLKESVASTSADEVAGLAADRIADELATSSAVPPAPPRAETAASAVRSALDEIEAFAPQAAKADVEGKFFSMVNKAQAQSAGAYGSSGYGAAQSSVPPAYQAAYSGRVPNPGSLLSVRV